MGNKEGDTMKFDRDDIIKFLIDKMISTKARVAALETAFLAYVALQTPDRLNTFEKTLRIRQEQEIQKGLDDLKMVDLYLSDLLRSELDDLNP